MGFSISWCAIQGQRGDVLAAARFHDTGEPDECFESVFSGAEFPGGWVVIVSRSFDYFASVERLGELSKGRRLVAALVEEHVMFSKASEWRDGVELWSAEHEGEGGDFTDLKVSGSPPPMLADVQADLMRQQQGQDDVDFGFDIPLTVAQQITGFKHDATQDVARFTRLELLRAEPVGPEDLGGRAASKRGLFGWMRK